MASVVGSAVVSTELAVYVDATCVSSGVSLEVLQPIRETHRRTTIRTAIVFFMVITPLIEVDDLCQCDGIQTSG